jgi:hypothetical protein
MSPPNPILNEEELDLLNDHPEECLRRVVGRGALSLDQITADLPSRVAAVVRSIATGERPIVRGVERDLGGIKSGPRRSGPGAYGVDDARPSGPLGLVGQMAARTRQSLSFHPRLTAMVDEEILTADEALQAAHAIDHVLDRYLTGTRYAAP